MSMARGARMRAWGVLLLALAANAVSAQPVTVTPQGLPFYSFPIPVPSGIAGLAPHVALLHDGGRANGPLGVGWSLQGTSAIARCEGIAAIDGAARKGVAHTPDDKLCLDGQRLIQVDASGNVAAFPQTGDSLGLSTGYREYRTERDAFARIRAYGVANGSAANGPAYFKVWTKDGRIHEYGTNANGTANATISAIGASTVIGWGLSRSSDTRGNYIDFQYDPRSVDWGSATTPATPGREWNLVEVRYTGTPTQAPTSKVVFVYEDRPATAPAGQAHDRTEAYAVGTKHLSVRRLAKVQTFVNTTGTPLKSRTYKLAYGNGPVSNRSRLEQITECVGAAEQTCLPPTRLEYEAGAGTTYQPSAAFNAGPLDTLVMHSGALGTPPHYGATPAVRYGVLTADFNADGRTDIIRWSDDPAQNQLYLSNGDGSFTRATNFNITSENFYKTDGCYSSRVVDMNGDGVPDVFRYRQDQGMVVNWEGSSHPCPPGTNEIFLGNGDGSFTRKPVTGVSPLPWQSLSLPTFDPATERHGWTRGSTYYLLDVDGDGRMDLVTTELPFQPLSMTEPDNPCAAQICTRVFLGNGVGGFSEVATNLAHRTLYSPPQGAYALGQPSHVNDVDGDHLADITDAGGFGLDHSSNLGFRSRGDGNFDIVSSAGCDTPIDYNGDSRRDCLFPVPNRTTAPYALLTVANGSGGTLQAANNFASALREELYVSGGKKTTANVVVADFDDDHREDVLRWHDDPSRNALFLSNGDGTFRDAAGFNLKGAADQLQKSDESAAFVVADFTGRGNAEILRLRASPATGDATSNQLYVKTTASPPPDVLKAVVSGTGARTTVTWVSLGNSASGSLGARYRSDRGTAEAASYPSFDLMTPTHVVATLANDNGVGSGTVTTEYGYAGLKARHDGRGTLGFREVRHQQPDESGAKRTQVSRFLQVHPYTGMNASVELWLGALDQTSPPVVGRTRTLYCDTTAAAGAQAAATVTAPCPTAAKIQRPYAYQSTDEAWDVAGTAQPPVTTITTTSTVNASSNPTQVVAVKAGKLGSTDQTFTETTTYQYQADDIANDAWVLGRVSSATVQSTVPNSLASLTTSAGSGAYASATAGSGPTQAATLSNVSFGSVNVGASTTGTATLASSGPAALSLTVPSAASVSGAGFGFVSTTCGSTLAAGANCSVSLNFAPASVGALNGTLTIATGAGNVAATLTGTGSGSKATVTANAAFGSNGYGAAIANQGVTVRNDGNAAMTLTVSGHSAPFALVSNGCSGVAPGANCSIAFSMASSTIGTASQTITLSGASSGAVNATLSGTVTGSRATVTAGDLAFGATAYGAAAPSKTLTLRNDGNVAMTLSLNGLSAPFSVSGNTCNGIAAGASCTIAVSIATSTMGSWSQAASTSGASINASLTATGTVTASVATLTAGTLSFGGATLDAAALSRTLTLRNDGNTAMTLTGLSGLSAPFSVSGNGCSNVAAGASCAITVSMATSSLGSWSQSATTVGATTNASTSASGSVSGSIATFIGEAGPALSFGAVGQGGAAPSRSWAFRNDGNTPLSLSLSALNSPFSATNYCGGSVSPGNTCSIVAQMGTASVGSFSQGSIAVSGAARGNRSDFSVAGSVNPSTTTMAASPASLTWSSVTKGSTTPRTLTLTNTGSATATGLSYAISYTTTSNLGDHTLTGGTCPAAGGSLAAGASCTLTVSFAANCTGGTRNGTLNISGNFSLLAVPLNTTITSSGSCL